MTATTQAEATAIHTLELEPRPARLPAIAERAQSVAAVSDAEAGSLIHVIAAAARDPAVDIDKMERLWAMHERLKNRAGEEAFNAAMNRAQSQMGRVSADAANPQTKSLYATYGKLDKAVRPIYSAEGFSISFNEGEGAPEGHARILAYVSHSAGHTRTYKLDMPNDGKGAKGGDVMTKTHATGAAHSYGRRYLLKDIFNIAIGEEDNDGNGDGAGSDGVDVSAVGNALCDSLLARLEKCATDEEAAALWAEGSKALAEAKRQDLYAEFKDCVVKHRTLLKNGGRK